MELIGGFIKCHQVCGNICEVSFVTNLQVLPVTNTGNLKFRLNINILLSFIDSGGSRPWAKGGPGLDLLAMTAIFPSVISSFFTQNKGGRAPPLDPPLIEEEINKLLRRIKQRFHSILQPWQTHNRYKTAGKISWIKLGWFQKVRRHSSVLCT